MKVGFLAALLALVAGTVGAMVYFVPDALVQSSEGGGTMSSMMELTSVAFENNGMIPAEYTCDGDNQPVPLSVSGVPEGARSLALVVDDPDIPEEVKVARGIDVFDHWVLYNINPDTAEITPGSGAFGLNSAGSAAYTGPCPPSQYEPKEHRYVFTLYALSGSMNFIKAPTKEELLAAIEGQVIQTATLTGRYRRQ